MGGSKAAGASKASTAGLSWGCAARPAEWQGRLWEAIVISRLWTFLWAPSLIFEVCAFYILKCENVGL